MPRDPELGTRTLGLIDHSSVPPRMCFRVDGDSCCTLPHNRLLLERPPASASRVLRPAASAARKTYTPSSLAVGPSARRRPRQNLLQPIWRPLYLAFRFSLW